MKTNPFNLNLIILLMAIAAGTIAQSSSSRKTCINLDEITNGKIIKIDTCFIGMSLAEVHKQLTAMGINDIQNIDGEIDSVNLIVNKEENEIDSVRNELIIINKDEDGNPGDEKVKIISNQNGKSNTMIVNGNGYAYSYAGTNGEAPGTTEIIMKKGSGDSNHNETRIYMIRKIEIHSLSDSDNVKGRTGVAEETHPFNGLQVYPNPAESTVTISYSSSSSEPLHIQIYDANGKAVYTEKIKQPGQQVSQTVSLSALSPGIYFVKLSQGNQNETRKIIVQ